MDVRKVGCYSADAHRAVTRVSETSPPDIAEPEDLNKRRRDTAARNGNYRNCVGFIVRRSFVKVHLLAAVDVPAARNCILLESAGTSTAVAYASGAYSVLGPSPIAGQDTLVAPVIDVDFLDDDVNVLWFLPQDVD